MSTPDDRFASAAEMTVLEQLFPPRLTESSRVIAQHMYLALVLADARAGTATPRGEWLQQLQRWAALVMQQLRYLSDTLGGLPMYLAKNGAFDLDPRDRAIWDKFRGDNYKELAAEHGLTEMRVRQIVAIMRREDLARRQRTLDLDVG